MHKLPNHGGDVHQRIQRETPRNARRAADRDESGIGVVREHDSLLEFHCLNISAWVRLVKDLRGSVKQFSNSHFLGQSDCDTPSLRQGRRAQYGGLPSPLSIPRRHLKMYNNYHLTSIQCHVKPLF